VPDDLAVGADPERPDHGSRQPVARVQGGGHQGAAEDDAGAAQARRHGAGGRLRPHGGRAGLVLQPDPRRRERGAPQDHEHRLTARATPESPGTETALSAPGPVLEVSGLRKTFGRKEVLKGLDIAVRPGELTVVLGANGSGKSTLLRCALRLVEPDAG